MNRVDYVKIPEPIVEAADRAFREGREFYVIPGGEESPSMTITEEMPMVDHFQVSVSGAVHFAFWNESIGDVELVSVQFKAAR